MQPLNMVLLSAMLMAGFACSKEAKVNPELLFLPDVWATGYQEIGGIKVACYWKNKESFRLTTGPYHSIGYAIAWHKDTIYIAGAVQQPNGHYKAVYWVNGIPVPLPANGEYALALDIAVNDRGVHVCGVDQSSNGSTPVYWHNGMAMELNAGTWATAISLYKDDVYIAGVESSTSGLAEAKYWKNGEVNNLTTGLTETLVYDIAVDSSAVYVAGYEKNTSGVMVASYWKNGVAVNLSDGTAPAKATALALSPSAVVAAGISYAPSNRTSGVFWKNDVPFPLETLDNHTAVYGISFFNQDVYTSGNDRNKACYWVNKKQVLLTDGSSPAVAHSIFIREKK